MLWAHTHKSKLKTHHNFFIFRMKLSKDLDQITESRKTTHRLGTPLTIQLYRWSAIFTVTHCLDSDGRQHVRNVDEEGLEKSHQMILPITSSQNENNSCQCMLTRYRWQRKLRTFWRCGPHCKRKSIWKTRHRWLVRYILDVLSEQHKSITEWTETEENRRQMFRRLFCLALEPKLCVTSAQCLAAWKGSVQHAYTRNTHVALSVYPTPCGHRRRDWALPQARARSSFHVESNLSRIVMEQFCSRSWSAQIQMPKMRRKSQDKSHHGTATWEVTFKKVCWTLLRIGAQYGWQTS